MASSNDHLLLLLMVLGIDWAQPDGSCSGSVIWLQSDGGWGWGYLEGFLIHMSGRHLGWKFANRAGTAGALWESLSLSLFPHGDLGITGLITWWLEAPIETAPRETTRSYIALPNLPSELTSHMSLLQHSVPWESHRGPAKCKERGQRLHRLKRDVFKNLQTCFYISALYFLT